MTEELRKLVLEDYTRMNLPADFRKAELKDIPDSIREPITKYHSNIDKMIKDGIGLLMYGPAGVGKTTTAAFLAKEVRRRARPVFFATVSDLREMLRTNMAFDDSLSIFERVRKVSFLVLDAIRPEDAKGPIFGAVDLARLIETRCAWKRTTVLTTQLAPGTLDELFPGMMEQARTRCVPLAVTGPNRRDAAEDTLRERLLGKKGT